MNRHILGTLAASFLIASPIFCKSEASKQTPQESIALSAEHQKAIEQRLNDFIKTHVAPLNPEELQYLTNVIYFSYALGSLDAHVRDKAHEILVCAKAVHHGLRNYEQTTQYNKHLVKALNRIDDAVAAQINHLTAWQHCCDVEEKLDQESNLFKAVEAFKDIVAFEVGHWATENKDAFDKQLEETAQIFIESGEALTMAGYTYKSLHQNTAPLPSNLENKYVAKIGVASRTIDTVNEHCWEILGQALEITQSEEALQVLSIAIMGMYYKEVYKHLVQNPAQYHTFMYNEQGLIPVEKRTQELPTMQ